MKNFVFFIYKCWIVKLTQDLTGTISRIKARQPLDLEIVLEHMH